VGIRAGVDTIIHAARLWVHRNRQSAEKVLLKRDIKNAFNTADPKEFLADCCEHMPASARFAEFCYALG